jgi:hypothetical protein
MRAYNKERNSNMSPEERDLINARRRGGTGAERAREARRRDPDRFRGHSLKYRFGITLDEYNDMLEAAAGSCQACGERSEETLHVDHDHNCCPGKRSCGGCIRGLLCGRCNRLLGMAKDDPEILLRAIAYLGKDALQAN